MAEYNDDYNQQVEKAMKTLMGLGQSYDANAQDFTVKPSEYLQVTMSGGEGSVLDDMKRQNMPLTSMQDGDMISANGGPFEFTQTPSAEQPIITVSLMLSQIMPQYLGNKNYCEGHDGQKVLAIINEHCETIRRMDGSYEIAYKTETKTKP